LPPALPPETDILGPLKPFVLWKHQQLHTPEAIQLAWLLRHPAGIQPIVGTTDPVRLVACCAADGITLSREEWYALFTAARGDRVP